MQKIVEQKQEGEELDLRISTQSDKPKVEQTNYTIEQDLLIMSSLRPPEQHFATAKHEGSLKGLLPAFVTGAYEKIEGMHDELQGMVNSLEQKIDAVIAKEEKDFLSAYKAHLLKIQCELNAYKARLSEQEFRLKKDTALTSLGESLDFFKHESLKLAQVVTSQKAEIEALNVKIETLEHDKTFFEEQVKKAKRENKALQLAINKLEQQIASQIPPEVDRSAPFGDTHEVEQPGGLENRGAGTRNIESAKVPTRLKQVNYHAKFDAFIKYLRSLSISKDQILTHCQLYYQAMVLKHDEIVTSLQQQLSHERKISQKLRELQTSSTASKNDLEQLFYECVEEVRRHISMRSVAQTRYVKHGEQSFKQELGGSALARSYYATKDKTLRGMDKAKIMEQFMTNDKLLRTLYETIFNPKSKAEASDLPVLGARDPTVFASMAGSLDGKTSQTVDFGRKRVPTDAILDVSNIELPRAKHEPLTEYPNKSRRYRSAHKVSRAPKYYVKNGRLLIAPKPNPNISLK